MCRLAGWLAGWLVGSFVRSFVWLSGLVDFFVGCLAARVPGAVEGPEAHRVLAGRDPHLQPSHGAAAVRGPGARRLAPRMKRSADLILLMRKTVGRWPFWVLFFFASICFPLFLLGEGALLFPSFLFFCGGGGGGPRRKPGRSFGFPLTPTPKRGTLKIQTYLGTDPQGKPQRFQFPVSDFKPRKPSKSGPLLPSLQFGNGSLG